MTMMLQIPRQNSFMQRTSRMSYHNQEPPFVTSVGDNDVLLGRGTISAGNEGNVRFRRLIRQHKAEYIDAYKRSEKDNIARQILEIIASRGGKFLRKVETHAELEQLRVPRDHDNSKGVWATVDEETKLQKIKQALRNKEFAYGDVIPCFSKRVSKDGNTDTVQDGNATNRVSRGVEEDERESNLLKAGASFAPADGALGWRTGEHSSNEKDLRHASFLAHKYALASLAGIDGPREPQPVPLTTPRRLSDIGTRVSFLSMEQKRPSLPSGWMPGIAGPRSSQEINYSIMPRQLMEQTSNEERRFRTTMSELLHMRMLHQGTNPPSVAVASLERGGYSASGASMYADLLEAEMIAKARRQEQQIHGLISREASTVPRPRIPIDPPQGPPHPIVEGRAADAKAEAKHDHADTATKVVPPRTVGATSVYSTVGATSGHSTGERAVALAIVNKQRESSAPTEEHDFLELSHIETMIVAVLCSRGLPVWEPDGYDRSFSSLTSSSSFAKSNWSWVDFARTLKQESQKWHSSARGGENGIRKTLSAAIDSALDYERNPLELAKTSVMLLEKLRQHTAGRSTGTPGAQKNRLDLSITLWLGQELSRWAMTLKVAAPESGKPVPFSSVDFLVEHPQFRANESVKATAAFDSHKADDVVNQVALLTRIRSIFTKNKALALRAKMEQVVKRIDHPGVAVSSRDMDVETSQDMLLCDRLLSEGFSDVLTTTKDLGPDYKFPAKVCVCPPFKSVGLTKPVVQERAHQILQELHAAEESIDLDQLWDDRMERMAKLVRGAGSSASDRSGEASLSSMGKPKVRTGLHLKTPGGGMIPAPPRPSAKKRPGSEDNSTGGQQKKQKNKERRINI